MDAGPVEARRLELDLAGVTASAAGEEAFAPVEVVRKDTCRAASAGPAVFRVPVVLPSAGRVTGGGIALCPSASGEVTVGRGPSQQLSAGEKLVVALTGESFDQAGPWKTEELDFSDFQQLVVRVAVSASADRQAELTLEGTIDYTLPVESAAGYLTYIMTQA
jgi:hypothetical protein